MSNSKTSPLKKNRNPSYDVALSFAEEDRHFVDQVAEYLKERGLRIFYDKDEMIFSWGKNLNGHLDNVYRKKATYCVMFISRHYKEKRWTKHERIRAQARSFEEHREYILPFRIDDTEIEGVEGEIVYLSVKEYDEKHLADAIFDKVESNKTIYGHAIYGLQHFFFRKSSRLYFLFAIIGILLFLFSDKITPVDVLTRKIRERSKEKYHCAVCKDGTISYSEGQGTCSHHGGVAFYIDSTMYHKSFEQSMKEAKETTILPP